MKTMSVKIRTFLMAVTMLVLSTAYAQEGDMNKADRIEALRVAYISQELNLSPAEAQKFWPVYNQYRDDLQSIRRSFSAEPGKMTPEQKLDFEQRKLDLKKRYLPRFESSLGKEKCDRLYGLEDKFRERLKELRDQRQQMKGDRPNMGRGGLAPR